MVHNDANAQRYLCRYRAKIWVVARSGGLCWVEGDAGTTSFFSTNPALLELSYRAMRAGAQITTEWLQAQRGMGLGS